VETLAKIGKEAAATPRFHDAFVTKPSGNRSTVPPRYLREASFEEFQRSSEHTDIQYVCLYQNSIFSQGMGKTSLIQQGPNTYPNENESGLGDSSLTRKFLCWPTSTRKDRRRQSVGKQYGAGYIFEDSLGPT